MILSHAQNIQNREIVYLKHFIFFKVILGKVLTNDNTNTKYQYYDLLIGNIIITNNIDFIPKKRNEE